MCLSQVRWVALLLVVFLGLEWAAPALAQEAQPPAARAVIPAGTRFSVTLKQKLESGKGKAGDEIAFTVTNDVRATDGTTVWIPRGALAIGTLQESSGPKNRGRPGKLIFTCDRVQAGESGQIPVRLVPPGQRKGGDLRAVSFLVALPFYLLGTLFIFDDATKSYDWVDGIGFIFGAFALIVGGVVQTLVGTFIKGKRVTVAEGTVFEVEALPQGPLSRVRCPGTEGGGLAGLQAELRNT